MDIYSQASLIANSTTFVNVLNKKVKGVMCTNSGATSSATFNMWSATGGVTFSAVIPLPANNTVIFPVKISGASAGSGVSVYGLY